ncbi:MAG: hypothetical protein WDN69_23480 [Aliidongia sp.]
MRPSWAASVQALLCLLEIAGPRGHERGKVERPEQHRPVKLGHGAKLVDQRAQLCPRRAEVAHRAIAFCKSQLNFWNKRGGYRRAAGAGLNCGDAGLPQVFGRRGVRIRPEVPRTLHK